jgi:hypothetical protein
MVPRGELWPLGMKLTPRGEDPLFAPRSKLHLTHVVKNWPSYTMNTVYTREQKKIFLVYVRQIESNLECKGNE